MRRDNTRPLGEVLKEYVEAFRLEGKIAELRILEAWPEVVGTQIAAKTSELNISNKNLYVKIQSSIIRQELFLIRTELAKKLNAIAGEEVIDQIVIY